MSFYKTLSVPVTRLSREVGARTPGPHRDHHSRRTTQGLYYTLTACARVFGGRRIALRVRNAIALLVRDEVVTMVVEGS